MRNHINKIEARARDRRTNFLILIITLIVLIIATVLAIKMWKHEHYEGNLLTLQSFNIRKAPKLDAEILGQSDSKEIYWIVDTVKGEASMYGNKWYKIKYLGENGYLVKTDTNQQVITNAQADKLRAIYTDTDPFIYDEQFKTVLELFPESYRLPLSYLHLLEPEWKFEPFYTNLSFAHAVEEQSNPENKNLIQFEEGSEYFQRFAWMKKNDNLYDGTNWYPANSEAIAYYMDPRNFLTYKGIWQFLDYSYVGDKDSRGIESIFAGNEFLLQYSETVLEAAKAEKILPEALASRISNEIRIGDTVSIIAKGLIHPEQDPLIEGKASPGFLSREEQLEILEELQENEKISDKQQEILADLKNGGIGYPEPKERYYNFLNIGAYPDISKPLGALVNAARYAAGEFEQESSSRYKSLQLPWTSPEKAIRGGAFFIAHDYIHVGQSTPYLQKFDLVTGSYSHQYMQALFAAVNEADRLYSAWRDSSDSWGTLKFSIPVYLEMPETTLPQ